MWTCSFLNDWLPPLSQATLDSSSLYPFSALSLSQFRPHLSCIRIAFSLTCIPVQATWGWGRDLPAAQLCMSMPGTQRWSINEHGMNQWKNEWRKQSIGRKMWERIMPDIGLEYHNEFSPLLHNCTHFPSLYECQTQTRFRLQAQIVTNYLLLQWKECGFWSHLYLYSDSALDRYYGLINSETQFCHLKCTDKQQLYDSIVKGLN